ncbi:MAG: hypothetical protein LQ342_004645 [Letrouitia transgressa]|nr:MAG: hypothetical protein LQ342_004645 [Letrouitia transgressa]
MSQGIPFPYNPGIWNSASPTSISQFTQYCYRLNASLNNLDSALEDRVEEINGFIRLLHSDPPRYTWYHFARQIVPCLNPSDCTRLPGYLTSRGIARRLIRGVQDIVRIRYGENGGCEETDLHYENRMVKELFMNRVKSIICPDFTNTKEEWERVEKVTMMVMRNESERQPKYSPLL